MKQNRSRNGKLPARPPAPITECAILEKIDALKKEHEAFLRAANERLAFLNGQIAALQALVEGQEAVPEAAPESNEVPQDKPV